MLSDCWKLGLISVCHIVSVTVTVSQSVRVTVSQVKFAALIVPTRAVVTF